MDSQGFNQDVATGEQIDTVLQDQFASLEDIMGSLEAVQEETSKLEPLQQLTDHQQEMVDAYRDVAHTTHAGVYAVADKKALEAYVDLRGNLITGDAQSPYPTCPVRDKEGNIDDVHGFLAENGANIWGRIDVYNIVVPGNEGFFELTSGLAKKAVVAFNKQIPETFLLTSKGINHYIEMADKLRMRLLNLKPLLDKRDFPYTNVFDFGVYSRFFQVAGQSIDCSSAFEAAMDVQSRATQHVVTASNSFAIPMMEKLMESLQALQTSKAPEADRIIALRDSIQSYWESTWASADITTQPGQTPQSIANAFPDRKFVSLAPLLDNRYLIAHRPKSDGGNDPVRITNNIKHYGASVAFDKVNGVEGYKSMDVPNIDDLSKLVTQTINTLYDMKGLKHLADQNAAFAKDVKKATDLLNKLVSDVNVGNKEFFGFVSEYFKVATAICQVIAQPYVAMMWAYIRCAIVVVSLVELAVLEDTHQHVVSARFFAKQNTEFSSPAMESYQTTQRVLQAAKSAHLSR